MTDFERQQIIAFWHYKQFKRMGYLDNPIRDWNYAAKVISHFRNPKEENWEWHVENNDCQAFKEMFDEK